MFLGPGSGLLAKGLTYGKKAMDFMRDPTSVINPISYIVDKIAITDNEYVRFAKEKYNQA